MYTDVDGQMGCNSLICRTIQEIRREEEKKAFGSGGGVADVIMEERKRGGGSGNGMITPRYIRSWTNNARRSKAADTLDMKVR